MIKLKELLNESSYVGELKYDKWYPAHTRGALKWTLTQDYVPLYPKQIERLFGKVPINSFHVTSPQNLSTIKDIIGKKKSISTFTQAGKGSNVAKGRGVQTGSGGVIFHVKGTLLARRVMDFSTVPDKTGRRWVLGRYIFGGDSMLVRQAIKSAGLPDYSEWMKMENDIVDKYDNYDYDSYKDYVKAIKKELGVIASKHIKKYIDITNGLLKKYRGMVQSNLRVKNPGNSEFWNEILIYDTKIIDAFVLKRVWDDYYFQKDSYNNKLAYKKDLLKLVPEKKITIGTPAQYRKWFTKREGEITI